MSATAAHAEQTTCPACNAEPNEPCRFDCVGLASTLDTLDPGLTRDYCTCPPHVQCPAVRAPYCPDAPAYCEHCGLDMDPNINEPDILA